MNEQSLVANLLFLVESEYPSEKGDTRPQVSIAAWTQYILDNFATVEQAVADMRKEAFRPIVVTAPNGVEGKIHLSISDARETRPFSSTLAASSWFTTVGSTR